MGLFSRKPAIKAAKKGAKHLIVTHSGNFHPDDAFAVAALRLAFGLDFRVVRTRDEKIISETLALAADGGHFVVDVGGGYDPARHLFDHHQQGGAGVRPSGIPYASFGLVWKHYGEQACSRVADISDILLVKATALRVDKKLVAPLDAEDNAVALFDATHDDVVPYELADAIDSFMPQWNEDTRSFDDGFTEAVRLAETVLGREIHRAASKIAGFDKVEEAYRLAKDKRLIVLEQRFPWREALLEHPEPLFVVGPDKQNGTWGVRVMYADDHSFANRAYLPVAWAGKRDAELAEITGVSDAIFCHNGRFLAGARSRAGALKLAELALAEHLQSHGR